MKILAVETATTWQSVAILDESRVLAQHEQEAGGAHGALLLPTIDRLLMRARVPLHELSGLICSAGPGSFTGIRVGLATCLGLRAATGRPLVLVPTLEAMASNMDTTIQICSLLPSRRGEVYWALFRRSEDGRVERVLDEQVGTEQAFVQSLHEPTVVVGAGWVTMASETRDLLSQSGIVTVGPEQLFTPSAVSVARIGMARLQRGEVAGEAVAPLYVQRAEAEIQYERSGGLSSVVRRQRRVERKAAERMARARRRSDV
ncbi:MAG: tRNA (adenosine(37)-N6)-threonylcarbamoyltransferase complex dimerization subunit type 1 TsaB [Nitrospira sp.]|nr:tRNA (adenosine(37)-N6)-threonylcarbamoyltransferase complex dimerization subunit type 1 TsaB [Nitrospira sp.]MDH4302740.1 tRNA (adenosine(37)-N6)-threonylcarbamoyltransferase complex dimerization subunit type 1 TsaB [Nitrospira sp.]MDH5192140.1 tRNA (adenosine(37)-N6)-threonylcarbamoyltransferase complex dimerization subunit type 1 TsaB [Nitrospira sp.]